MEARLNLSNPCRWLPFAGLLLGVAVAGCSRSETQAMQQGAVAQQQLNNGQIAEASRTIAQAVRERDDIPELQLLRARIAMAANATDEAYAAYGVALALDNSNVEALEGVARLGLQSNNLDPALDAATKLLTLNPQDRTGLFVTGMINLLRNRTLDAIENARALLAIDPVNEIGTMLLARALVVDGKTDEAIATIARTASVIGMTTNLSLMQLEFARAKGDAAGMSANFARLRNELPDDMDLRLDEADLRYKTGNAPAARALITRVIGDRKLDVERARNIRALLAEYDLRPFSDEALAQLSRKSSDLGRETLARFYLDHGQPRSAAIVLGGAGTVAVKGLEARIAASTRRDASALAIADAILKADTSHCDALLARSEVLLHRRKVDPAIVAIQTAQAQCPQFLSGWLLLARAYDAKNDPTGVMRAFEQGIDADPLQSFLPTRYVAWLTSRGDESRAQGVARRLVGDAPALLSGWKLYLDICRRRRDEGCVADATDGMARARTMFGMDVPAGKIPTRGFLFARLKRN